MTNKYLIIEIENGKPHTLHVYDNTTDRPINEEELVYAELTQEMVDALTTHERIIDWSQSGFQNGQWNVTFITPEKITNYLQNRENARTALLTEANLKLTIPDISNTFRTLVNSYITNLNNLQFSNNEIQQIEWPQKPW